MLKISDFIASLQTEVVELEAKKKVHFDTVMSISLSALFCKFSF